MILGITSPLKILFIACLSLIGLCLESNPSWAQAIDDPAIIPKPTLTDAETPRALPADIRPAPSAPNTPVNSVKIAIIIDDLGYNLKQGIATARIPGALTLAVLPQSPNGIAIAELGHQQGKLIMVHAPMSNLQQLPLDTGGLTETMSQQEFVNTLYQNLDSIPHSQGLNNHMGSHLTQLQQPMQWLMETLARESLFFIDSRTSPESIAWETAQRYQVPTRKRDVFLDNHRTQEAIGEQFDELLRIAKRRGNAIAIGHPYPETINFLAGVIPSLHQLGVELVPVSDLIPTPEYLDRPQVPEISAEIL
ncbi:MAG: divergent polysaccharide deacetylase family protein [Cellvibrionaceae bacterium]